MNTEAKLKAPAESAPGGGEHQGFAKSRALFERASEVVPGGIYGHVTPALLEPGESPYYAARAQGCRYEDVDGNAYLDFMCGYGPIVLGHGHPEVEEAVTRARAAGVCLNHPTETMVELAERLVGLIDFADWAVFAKNGSDVTTWCVQVAREATGRRKILTVEGAYHGWAPWCTPGHGGLLEEDRAHIAQFRWNDSQSLQDAVTRHAGDIAAVMLTPFHHPMYVGSTLPDPEFVEAVNTVCEHEGILLIVDDIRGGFRINLNGSHREFGFTPDLGCYCKALANGYPISAAVGSARLKAAASRVFLTGSYWNGPAEMVAALATLHIIERDDVVGQLRERGTRFMRGLESAAGRAGFDVQLTGPPALPFMTFADDPGYRLRHAFARRCFRAGLFLHPHHNWFLCAAHDDQAIAEALATATQVFEQLAEYGPDDWAGAD